MPTNFSVGTNPESVRHASLAASRLRHIQHLSNSSRLSS